ncbi:hypothetical protein M409DRAFT_22221 [Zasmidium cellare ATCC 36951]|uniref:SMODS and SLOG-associating 2TM effector domain-containing protein n=1 Tax=Zasmidium cellare ATCC 36951 TaxID=1080233 RepID=A0A6A6CK49_ZASCE|nr:uncharacterized protein M409DRAFT_22221 [Zasmidium cellare ATCC 36951]KAF2167411.1 hypothetical protein M409DRAFT_22221 [Zasmidium cellare ATCC 36951]
MATSMIDIEKGDMTSTISPLGLFQLLVGIHTHPSLTTRQTDAANAGQKANSRSDNVGLYQRIKAEERRLRIQYALTSYINNSLYMLQILLAATFTALSAYKDTHPVSLTVLGAINTVLAGCLAWQKGQGVPQRYRKARDQYQALLLEIESSERSFITNDGDLDPRAEKARLQKLFDVARADQQANYPDLYVSTEGHGKEGGKRDEERVERLQKLLGELEGRLKVEGGGK